MDSSVAYGAAGAGWKIPPNAKARHGIPVGAIATHRLIDGCVCVCVCVFCCFAFLWGGCGLTLAKRKPTFVGVP